MKLYRRIVIGWGISTIGCGMFILGYGLGGAYDKVTALILGISITGLGIWETCGGISDLEKQSRIR